MREFPCVDAVREADDVMELVLPTTRLRREWVDAHDDWGPGLHEDGFGLTAADDVDSPAGFDAWVGRLRDEEARCASRWIVEDGRVLGGIALRLGDDEFVREHGHIGYGVRPSDRGRGVATWALGRMLDQARRRGMSSVLAVCEMNNIASAKTLERRGGAPECFEGAAVRRYWFDVGAR